jgi:hypothetical protein
MTAFSHFSIATLCVFNAFLLFLLVRNEMTYRIRIAFIDDDDLYPDAYKRLPRYRVMSDHPKHYLRWTKRQWIAYTEAA